MAADLKFSVKSAMNNQMIRPVAVSEETRQKFLKQSKAAAWKFLPASIVISVVVSVILYLIVHYLRRYVISFFALIAVILPFYAVYNIVATGKAIRNNDYEFFEGVIIGKTDSGYKIRGLEEHNASVLLGKRDYEPGEMAVVARLNDELSLISE